MSNEKHTNDKEHTPNEEQLLSPFNVTLYGKPVKGIHLEADKFGQQIKQLLERTRQLSQQSSKQPLLRLGNIYGYLYENQYHPLPRPTAFLVIDEGESCKSDEFPEKYKHWKNYNKWVSDPMDPSIRFEFDTGTLEELLLEPGEIDPTSLSEEGTLIRGADGRMYFIHESLEALEVRGEDEKSMLNLAESLEHPDLLVSSIALRGRMTFRGRMALRGRMTLRGRMAFRGRMTAPNRCR